MSVRRPRLPAVSLSPRAAHVGGVLVAGVLLRWLLYHSIAIRGDLGYWLLDGQYIVSGQTPFVDFIGRSPAFLYAYAGAIQAFGESLAVFRWFVAVLWLAVGVALYALAREAGGHRAGLITLAAATLTPIPVAYTFFSSSQSLGVFAVAVGLWVIVRWRSVSAYAFAGALVGVAFLSRRTMVLALPAVASWLALAAMRGGIDWRLAARRALAHGGGFAAALSVAYLAIAGGSPDTAIDLFIVHFVNLFVTTGAGGVPLLSMSDAVMNGEMVSGTAWTPIRSLLDYRSQLALVATLIGGSTLLLGLADYLRAASDYWLREYDRVLILTMGVVVAGLAGAQAVVGDLWYRVIWLQALIIAVVALRQRDRLAVETLLHPALALPVICFAWILLGYLVRPNLLAAYYAMDYMLFLAVPAGVAAVRWWPSLDLRWRAIATTSLVVVLLVSATPLAPLTPTVSVNSDGRHERISFFTAGNVHEMNADLEARGADVVLTSQPNHVALNDVRAFESNTRALYLRKVFGDSGPQRDYYGRLIAAMRAGEVGYVVHDVANMQLLEANATAQRTFESCYSPVDADGLYRSLNTTLYRHDGCRE